MDFANLLSRADEGVLQEILGRQVIQLVNLLDPKLATPSKLKQIVLDLHSPSELLLHREYRACLLDLLRPEQANCLAQLLNCSKTDNPFHDLKKVSIRKGSDREQTLLDFFETYQPRCQNTATPPATHSTAVATYALFEHQRRAAQQVKDYLYNYNRRALLHMPTGSGKTRTAMNIIADHLRCHEPTTVIWLAYSEELCEQAVDEFQKAWSYLGNRALTVQRLWGTHDIPDQYPEDGIIVAGLSKVYSRTKTSIQFINQLGRRCSLVIIDEAHQAIAETYKLVLDALVIPYDNAALLDAQ